MKRLPAALLLFRVACGPSLVLATVLGAPAVALVVILTLALVSDVLDGVVARGIRVDTPTLRRADSMVDTALWLCALFALTLRSPGVVMSVMGGVVTIASLELARAILERAKFGRLASYHMWSAKLWGLTLLLGFAEAFLTGHAGFLLQACVIVGILSDIEGLAASLVLSGWHHDVATVWHAVSIERATARARERLGL